MNTRHSGAAKGGRSRRLGPAAAMLVLLAALGSPLAARADEDQERASRAGAAGRALPLQQILDRVRREFSGDILDVDFEEEHGNPRYEVKLLAADGRLLKLSYDAATGELLSGREKPNVGQQRR